VLLSVGLGALQVGRSPNATFYSSESLVLRFRQLSRVQPPKQCVLAHPDAASDFGG
jgi:hypothetical protein